MKNGKTKLVAFFGRASKKTIIVVSIIVILVIILGLGVLAANWKIKQMSSSGYFNASKYGRTMGQGKNLMFYNPTDTNQFVIPQDAAKSGELAIMVDSLDNAKNSIAVVAAKNGGNVYMTQISYLSGNTKNGSIVIQIPTENFDATFGDLKNIGGQIVQESSKKIPEVNILYPQPLSAPTAGSENVASGSAANGATASEKTTNTSQTADITSDQALIEPTPTYKQIVQDKGYIRVVFADYGTNGYSNKTSHLNIANVVGFGYIGQNMRNNIWVVMAIKSIFLIVLIAILFVVAKRITQNVKKLREKRKVIQSVKQSSRNRAGIIRIKKR